MTQNRSRSRSARMLSPPSTASPVHAGLHCHLKKTVDSQGPARPLKGMGACQHTKQMVMAFTYSHRITWQHIVPRGASTNATYTIKALGKFLEHFKKKKPTMAQELWWFHWDNAPVYTATSLKECGWQWKGSRCLKGVCHEIFLGPFLACMDRSRSV